MGGGVSKNSIQEIDEQQYEYQQKNLPAGLDAEHGNIQQKTYGSGINRQFSQNFERYDFENQNQEILKMKSEEQQQLPQKQLIRDIKYQNMDIEQKKKTQNNQIQNTFSNDNQQRQNMTQSKTLPNMDYKVVKNKDNQIQFAQRKSVLYKGQVCSPDKIKNEDYLNFSSKKQNKSQQRKSKIFQEGLSIVSNLEQVKKSKNPKKLSKEIIQQLNEENKQQKYIQQLRQNNKKSFSDISQPDQDWSPTSDQIDKLKKMKVDEIFEEYKHIKTIIDETSNNMNNQSSEQISNNDDSHISQNNKKQILDMSDNSSQFSDSQSSLEKEIYVEDLNLSDSIDTQFEDYVNHGFQSFDDPNVCSINKDRHNIHQLQKSLISPKNVFNQVLPKQHKVLYIRSIMQNSRFLKTAEEKNYRMEVIEQNLKTFNKKIAMHNKNYLNQMGIAITSKKGSKEDQPNQDDYVIYMDDNSQIYGVFDGHGPYGHVISNICYKILLTQIRKHNSWRADPIKCLQDIFSKLNNLVEKHLEYYRMDWCSTQISGCSCTVIIKINNILYIASVGDTKAIIFRNQQWSQNQKQIKENQNLLLTQQHTANQNLEKMRIYQNNGEIKLLQNEFISKVYVRGRNYPGLHITRSIGDQIAHTVGVISEPDLKKYEISKQYDNLLLLCTHSVTEYLDNDELSQIFQGYNGSQIKEAQDLLIKRIKQAWTQNENQLEDFTFILIYFE